LKQWGRGTKQDFIKLLFSKLPDVLDEKQKEYKVQNLLKALKKEQQVTTDSANRRSAYWILT